MLFARVQPSVGIKMVLHYSDELLIINNIARNQPQRNAGQYVMVSFLLHSHACFLDNSLRFAHPSAQRDWGEDFPGVTDQAGSSVVWQSSVDL